MKNIFTVNDIITIVMNELEERQAVELYGTAMNEELDLPYPIQEKINLLESDECEEFMKLISDIADEVYDLKSGELNERNLMHQEISYLAQDFIYEFLV